EVFYLRYARREGSLNIVLAETSCNSRPAYRAWCAVESMAQQNPEARVWYVMTAPAVEVKDGLPPRLLQQYTNLRVVTTDLGKVFSNTPLMPLYTSRTWNSNTTWPAINLSDMVRLALVWRVGGFYSDTDVVCISSLAALRNVVGFQSNNEVNGGIFHFDRHHNLLLHVMTRLSQNFNANDWGNNGPVLLTRTLKEACERPKLAPGDQCHGVHLLSWKAFYPVPYEKWRFPFLPRKGTINFTEVFPDSYVIHMWNKMSHLQPIFKDSGSIYDVAAKTFCPVTRAVATAHSSLY
ncbi:lactosylceramide 4-alpha-galactosyltransferase-like, partial [Cherax quadricarinatus]|uniref:lactosylceramide 4-alpha-galactosyltransferase-like n=1 Tax=Cherax quadricarinatus TaxID=27406 RepID=UPI00387ECE3F